LTIPLQEPNKKPTSKIDIPNTQDYATLMNSGAERSVVQKIAVKMAGAALLVCGTAFEIHAADEATKGEHGPALFASAEGIASGYVGYKLLRNKTHVIK
jgi:hypothetical protein